MEKTSFASDHMVTLVVEDQHAMFDAKLKKILKKGHDRIMIYHEGINALTILETEAETNYAARRICLDNRFNGSEGWDQEASNFNVMTQSMYRGIYFIIVDSWKA